MLACAYIEITFFCNLLKTQSSPNTTTFCISFYWVLQRSWVIALGSSLIFAMKCTFYEVSTAIKNLSFLLPNYGTRSPTFTSGPCFSCYICFKLCFDSHAMRSTLRNGIVEVGSGYKWLFFGILSSFVWYFLRSPSRTTELTKSSSLVLASVCVDIGIP